MVVTFIKIFNYCVDAWVPKHRKTMFYSYFVDDMMCSLDEVKIWHSQLGKIIDIFLFSRSVLRTFLKKEKEEIIIF